jgi:hypothetical protein
MEGEASQVEAVEGEVVRLQLEPNYVRINYNLLMDTCSVSYTENMDNAHKMMEYAIQYA